MGKEDTNVTLAFFDNVGILPHTDNGSIRAAEIVAESQKKGKALAATDALIAGVMLSNGCTSIVTRDSDFQRSAGMKVISY